MRGKQMDQYREIPERSGPPDIVGIASWKKLPIIKQILALFSSDTNTRDKDADSRYAEWNKKSEQ